MEKNTNEFMKKIASSDLSLIKSTFIDDDDLNFIHEIFKTNSHILFKNKKYSDAAESCNDFINNLDRLPPGYRDLFEDFYSESTLVCDYNLFLMYVIGLKKGILFNEIK